MPRITNTHRQSRQSSSRGLESLPHDVRLQIAERMPGRDLNSVARASEPFRTSLESSHASEAKYRMLMEHELMIPGPIPRHLHDKPGRDLLQNLRDYCASWTYLTWRDCTPLPLTKTAPGSTKWFDGTRKMGPCFLGESGGCLYSVYPTSHHPPHASGIVVYQLPSARNGQTLASYKIHVGFKIMAVACDLANDKIVLLQHEGYGPVMLHRFSIKTGEPLPGPYTIGRPLCDLWKGGFCTQLELFGDMIGVSFALPKQRLNTSDAALFVRFRSGGPDHAQQLSSSDDSQFWSFQFMSEERVLVCETVQGIANYGFACEVTELSMRLASISDDITIRNDIQNNRQIELPHKLHHWFTMNGPSRSARKTTWPPVLAEGWNISFVRNVSPRSSGRGKPKPAYDPFAPGPSAGYEQSPFDFPLDNYDSPWGNLLGAPEPQERPKPAKTSDTKGWDGPFHVNPDAHLIGLKFQFPKEKKSADHMWIFDSTDFMGAHGTTDGLFDTGYVNTVSALHVSEGYFHTLNGRRLISGTSDQRIVSEDFNSSATRLYGPRDPMYHPRDRSWVTQSRVATVHGKGNGKKITEATVKSYTNERPASLRLVTMEDNLIMLVDGKSVGQPQVGVVAQVYIM